MPHRLRHKFRDRQEVLRQVPRWCHPGKSGPVTGLTNMATRIPESELVLHYQPRISLCDRKLIGFEALVRWDHPEHGLLAPARFIPMAETNGLIVPINRWVLNTACCQMACWQRSFPMYPPLAISVNTSFRYLKDRSLVLDIERILEQSGLVPESLRLEMAEHSIMTRGETVTPTLRCLKAMRTGLEIDDFGAGRASLAYLRNLPFDTLKIDRSFVKELGTRLDSSAIIKTIVKFAGSLGMEVAAGGVETQNQLKQLTDLGCRRGQGYYFSAPVDAAHARALIESEYHERTNSRSSIHLV